MSGEKSLLPMAFVCGQEERDDLLGRFPLSETELDILLTLFPQYANTHATVFHPDPLLEQIMDDITSMLHIAMETVFVIKECPVNPIPHHYLQHQDHCRFLKERDRFLEAVVSLCGRRGERFLLEILFAMAQRHGPTTNSTSSSTKTSPESLASLIYRLCCTCFRLPQVQPEYKSNQDYTPEEFDLDERSSGSESDYDVNQVSTPQGWKDFFRSIGGDDEGTTVTRTEWKDWANHQTPIVSKVLSTLFHYYFFGPECQCKPSAFKQPYSIGSSGSLLWKSMHECVPMQLALMDLGGPWRRIFCSDEDGLSFETFHEALTSFSGPTVILIQTMADEKLGYYSDIPWRNSKHWFTGEGESFLFRLDPSWNVYKPQNDTLPKKHHQLLKTPIAQEKDNLLGLAVGGVAADHPRLHITMSLERCMACSVGAVFQSGPLLTNDQDHFFDVDIIEIWSVRADDDQFQKGRQVGHVHAEVIERHRQNAAIVDRTQFLEDFESGVFGNNLFSHRDQARGRTDFVAHPEGGGYYVQGKQPSSRIKKIQICDIDN